MKEMNEFLNRIDDLGGTDFVRHVFSLLSEALHARGEFDTNKNVRSNVYAINTAQTMEMLGISKHRINKLVESGALTRKQNGETGHHMYCKHEVEKVKTCISTS